MWRCRLEAEELATPPLPPESEPYSSGNSTRWRGREGKEKKHRRASDRRGRRAAWEERWGHGDGECHHGGGDRGEASGRGPL